MKQRFENELCVVTGGANGIGRAIVERLLEEGADVIVADYDVETVKTIYGDKEHVPAILKVDVTKMEELDKIAETLEVLGRKVKAVIPTVGNGPQNAIENISPQEFRLTMDLNVTSSFFTVQKVLPYMGSGSSIVLISSIAGFQGGRNAIVYNAAKAAIRSMARSFSGELAERGIRANAISPGPTETRGFSAFVGDNDEVRQNILSMIPLGHIGQPEEIAAAVAFLASDEASYVTGAELIADGGFTNR